MTALFGFMAVRPVAKECLLFPASAYAYQAIILK